MSPARSRSAGSSTGPSWWASSRAFACWAPFGNNNLFHVILCCVWK
uniref:Uncharacterized protein n=1 Tax=Arundo donax TaxID=35708 RepID=A0A0A9CR89_ARUDO